MIDQLITDENPIRADHPGLDPDHPRARAMLAAALRTPPVAPHRRPRRGVVTAGALVAAAAAALALAPGTDRLSAQAAMVQAAHRAADFSSGRIVTVGEHELHATGYRGRFVTETRYSGDAVASHHENAETLPGGSRQQRSFDFRQVDGRVYERADGERWRLIGRGAGATPLPAEVKHDTNNRRLLDVLRDAQGAWREPIAGGGETIHATVSAGRLHDIPLPMALLPIARIEGDERALDIAATIGDDGLLRAIEVRHDSEFARLFWRTEYHDLGAPQAIEAPPTS